DAIPTWVFAPIAATAPVKIRQDLPYVMPNCYKCIRTAPKPLQSAQAQGWAQDNLQELTL
ncbi:MAG: hypothetical protein OQK00_04975, partial [Rhodobacteraceae bacterium]|nr:hypothetical protein [Paracoccaceae bacterium]